LRIIVDDPTPVSGASMRSLEGFDAEMENWASPSPLELLDVCASFGGMLDVGGIAFASSPIYVPW